LPSFLTVKEAARLTGRSPSSIRRVIYPILQKDHHPDRIHIEPSVSEVVKLRLKGENFAWRLSEELLRRECPVEEKTERESSHAAPKELAHGDADLLAMLRRELDIKNQQITQQADLISKQVELISGLSERLREGNVLIGSLQQRLALPIARGVLPTEPVEAKPSAPAQSEKGSRPVKKSGKLKRSFLSRLFG
jgi:hypothetical protein